MYLIINLLIIVFLQFGPSFNGYEIKSLRFRILLTVLLDDIPRTEGLTKYIEMIRHMIMMNLRNQKKFSEANKAVSCTSFRHNKSLEQTLPSIVSLNVSSTVRSKELLQILYHHRISLSYEYVLSFYDKPSETMERFSSQI